MNLYYTQIESPVGALLIIASQAGLQQIHFEEAPTVMENLKAKGYSLQHLPPSQSPAAKQLGEYFQGARKTFDLPLDLQGTPFRKKVWQALCTIPFGETRSYKDIASAIGTPLGSRAVGQANGANPIPIIIPCHRVTAADGSLGGYSGGLHIKRALLKLEGVL